MIHIVYRTYDPVTGEYYIGKHSTSNPDDGYQGSGRWVQESLAAGRKLVTEHIASFSSEVEALEFERAIVTDKRLADPLCRNKTRGGRGSWWHMRGVKRTPEQLAAVAKAVSAYWNSVPPEERRKIRGYFAGKKRPNHARLMRERNPFKGRTHSAEARAKMAASRSPEERAATARGNTNTKGRVWFNDGSRSFLIPAEEGEARGLVRGRTKWK